MRPHQLRGTNRLVGVALIVLRTAVSRRVIPMTRLLSLAMLMILSGSALATQDNWPKLEQPDRTQLAVPPKAVKNFVLTDQDDKPFELQQLRGSAVLVFFGFTHCQNVCPVTMQKLREVSRSLAAPSSRFTVLMVSIDGERDTPSVMKRYLEPYEPGVIGVTGTPAAVREVAGGFSAIFFKGMPTDSAGGYDMEHTSQVYLIDPAGRLRASFYNAPSTDMTAAVRHVLEERS